MDENRRKLLGIIPFAFLYPKSTFKVVDQPKKSYKCHYCDKEYVFAENTCIETTAHTPNVKDRVYEIAGQIYFHSDGSRCKVELIKYEKLDVPIVHRESKNGK